MPLSGSSSLSALSVLSYTALSPAILFTLLMWFGAAVPWLAFTTKKMGHETTETKQNQTKLGRTLFKIAGFAVLMTLIIMAVCILASLS
jgi:hypothetical protein